MYAFDRSLVDKQLFQVDSSLHIRKTTRVSSDTNQEKIIRKISDQIIELNRPRSNINNLFIPDSSQHVNASSPPVYADSSHTNDHLFHFDASHDEIVAQMDI